jgi:hypothetical protein
MSLMHILGMVFLFVSETVRMNVSDSSVFTARMSVLIFLLSREISKFIYGNVKLP